MQTKFDGTRLDSNEETPVLSLMRELVDAFGTLMTGHLRLARAELHDDARRYARRATGVLVAAALLLVGYALACVAAALALTRVLAPPVAFLAIGGAHLVGAGAALAYLLTRAPPRPLDESLTALDQTVRTVATFGAGDGEGNGPAPVASLSRGGTTNELT